MSKEKTTKKEAEGIVDRFLASEFVAKVKVFGLTAKDLILIYVPFAIAAYLLQTQDDQIVIGLGIGIGLIGVTTTVKLAYGFESRSK